MARITWVDGSIPYAFGSPVPAPGDRFGNWTPNDPPVEDRHTALGTGVEVAFLFRRDYGASFEVRNVPQTALGVFFRLRRWLADGNLVTVETGDRLDRTYVCRQMPGTSPSYTLADAGLLEYTASFAMKNTAAADMLCEHDAPADD